MSAMDAKVLRRAAEIVEQGWCQGALARDADGRSLDGLTTAGLRGGIAVAMNPRAVSWCAVGAIYRAMHEFGVGIEQWPRFHTRHRVNFNNAPGRTDDEVASALRADADRCEAEA